MADPSIWSLDPHTRAKHQILEEYLKAWFPILSAYNEKILYIDGFSGPGIYENGEFGSPIIALRCLLEHSLKLCETRPKRQFGFLFIEEDAERARILNETINQLYPTIPPNVIIQIQEGECEAVLNPILSVIEREGRDLQPTFAFLDPFGYSGMPFNLIRRILSYNRCEVFVNFSYNSINRFIETYDLRDEIFDTLFGTPDWRSARGLGNRQERNRILTGIYTNQLKTTATYVRAFEMWNNLNQITYYLYFATNHRLGFIDMKKAMWKADPRGSFRFADTTDVGQKFLMSFDKKQRYQEQAELIFHNFAGKSVPYEKVKIFCSDSTGYPDLWSNSLRILEEEGKISVTNRKRNKTYPSDCIISFLKE